MPRSLGQAGSFLFGLWMALAVLQPLGTSAQATTGGGVFPDLEAALHTSINDVRSAQGLRRLERDTLLDAVARAHAEDMAARRYLAHETPEGLTPPDRMKRGGASGFTLAGENVGTTSRLDPNREIVEAWMASTVHRDNVLAPAFNTTGIGVARSADGSFYYTQLYATRPR
ncbi:MAG: hypothetical protein DCC71_09940 [Proteobacteria bacterium]|nr:MAG: hypothetical protein DCC71_09940 [Pseudomonadota bacterium]